MSPTPVRFYYLGLCSTRKSMNYGLYIVSNQFRMVAFSLSPNDCIRIFPTISYILSDFVLRLQVYLTRRI